MTDSQLLQQLIQRAIDGGWRLLKKDFEWKVVKRFGVEPYLRVLFSKKDDKPSIDHNVAELRLNVTDIIFNHEFAKALWGEEWDIPSPIPGQRIVDGRNVAAKIIKGEPWQYHLKQLVIHPKPLDYLREWLEKQND